MKKRRQGINEAYEIKLICKDGSALWALISAKFLDKYGRFIGSIRMLTESSNEKKLSRPWQTLRLPVKRKFIIEL